MLLHSTRRFTPQAPFQCNTLSFAPFCNDKVRWRDRDRNKDRDRDRDRARDRDRDRDRDREILLLIPLQCNTLYHLLLSATIKHVGETEIETFYYQSPFSAILYILCSFLQRKRTCKRQKRKQRQSQSQRKRQRQKTVIKITLSRILHRS